MNIWYYFIHRTACGIGGKVSFSRCDAKACERFCVSGDSLVLWKVEKVETSDR